MESAKDNRSQSPGSVDRPQLSGGVWFLACAILALPLVAVSVLGASPRLALLQYRSMLVLAANHLVTLGWGTMVAIGSLHQMLPAAAGVPRGGDRLMPFQFGLYLVGVTALAAGFGWHLLPLLLFGGGAVFTAILLAIGRATAVLMHRTRWLPSLSYIVVALACLGGVSAWGLILVLNWRFLFWRDLIGPVGLMVHLPLGLIGWFATLVAGVSYYLLPRFTGLKDPSKVHPRAVLVSLSAGLAVTLGGVIVLPAGVRIGLLLVAIGGFLYTADVVRFLHAWPKKARDITRAHWKVIAAETGILSAGLLGWTVGVLPGDPQRWAVAGVSLFLLGWVTLAITGQAYKVTPFLIWYYRYQLGMAPLEVPRLEAPYWPPAGGPSLALLACGGALVALGVLAWSPAVSMLGGLAFFAGAVVFSYLLGYSWLPRLWGR